MIRIELISKADPSMLCRPPKVPPEVQDVAEQVGDFIEYWGFKKVHGRIWTHLFLAEAPLDASDLMARLRISKALVSISLADLLDYEVIQIAGKSSKGTVTYTANGDVTHVIMNVLRQRERRLITRLKAATGSLSELPSERAQCIKIKPERVAALLQMVTVAETALDSLLQMTEFDYSKLNSFTDC